MPTTKTVLGVTALVALALVLALGCGTDDANDTTADGGGSSSSGGGSSSGTSGTSGSSSGGSSSGTTSGSNGDAGDAGACDPAKLHTGLTAPQNGLSVDTYDCVLLEMTAKHAEPDAMIFKAIIYVESRFQVDAAACPNAPCGTPTGWTQPETQCFGLMQIVPACSKPGDPGLLPNGHPNMTTDSTAALWSTSIFNPTINIDVGIAGIAGNRKQVKKDFPGCTEDQYTLMAIGNYNSYGSTKSCTVYNKTYDDLVLTTYRQYATASGWPAHPY